MLEETPLSTKRNQTDHRVLQLILNVNAVTFKQPLLLEPQELLVPLVLPEQLLELLEQEEGRLVVQEQPLAQVLLALLQELVGQTSQDP